MTLTAHRSALLVGALLTLGACGETSGSVLELVPESGPDAGRRGIPGSRPRIDVFVVRELSTCAVGEPCRQDEPDTRNDECIEIEEGDRTTGFRAETVNFLPPDDPYVAAADHVSCFRLIIDDDEMAAIDYDFKERFVGELFELSNGEILADTFVHSIPPIQGGLVPYENESGIFLPAAALDMAPSFASRETDFTFAVTGARDPYSGAEPRNEYCAGTVQGIAQGLAGAGYTWLTTECNRDETLLRAWMFQVRVALREVNDFNDYYDDYYPGDCHDPTPPPTEWWPSPKDCNRDPDAPTCGDNDCDDDDDDDAREEFARHVLTDHWPRGSSFVGNHCNNGEPDRNFNESGPDVGGVCDELGRPQQTAARPVTR